MTMISINHCTIYNGSLTADCPPVTAGELYNEGYSEDDLDALTLEGKSYEDILFGTIDHDAIAFEYRGEHLFNLLLSK
jgi:hypothetical protein